MWNFKFLTLLIGLSTLVLVGQGCSLSGKKPAGVGPIGIFASADSGKTWQARSALPNAQGVRQLTDTDVFKLVDDPSDSTAFYWLSTAKGLFSTVDDGVSWQSARPPASIGIIRDLSVDSQNRCRFIFTNGTQVFETGDCGREYKEIYREVRTKVSIRSLSIDPFNSLTIFLATDGGDILRSIDGGMNWQAVHRGRQQVVFMRPDMKAEGVWYAATRNRGLIKSTDGGDTWKDLSSSLEPFKQSLEFRRLIIHPNIPGLVYWVSKYGILVSSDGGEVWRPMKLITPPSSADIYAFAVDPNNPNFVYYTATVNNRSSFYRSEDGGESWSTEKLPSGQLPTALRVHPDKDKKIIYLGFSILPSR